VDILLILSFKPNMQYRLNLLYVYIDPANV